MSLARLSDAQRRAIDHGAARLQIVACAGSGKTEALSRRVARTLVEGADPSSVLAFTFTEKAAAELKTRIETRAAEADPRYRDLPPTARGLFVGTTHGWAFEQLQDLGGNYESYDALSDAQEWVVLQRFSRRLGLRDLYAAVTRSPHFNTAEAIGAFIRSAEVVCDERIDRALLASEAPLFLEVLERYEWLLGEMRLMPFREMLATAARELEPEGRLRARLGGTIGHVFVDEFQDFNAVQDAILARLAAAGATVTVVGDDDQAIYQWRGGDVRLFATFVKRYQAELAALEANYRSRPEIVHFAGGTVSGLTERIEKVLEAKRDAAASGAVEVLVAETPEAEAEAIAGRIATLLGEGHRAGEIAVLYRSVRTSSQPLVEALRSRGIPCSVVGRTSLLARPEMLLIAHVFVYWAGGTWYPNPEFSAEVVTRELLAAEIMELTGASELRAERLLRALNEMGERIRTEGVFDSVPVFDELLALLDLPGRSEPERRELGLGQLSRLLTEFDNAARRSAPKELYETSREEQQTEVEEDAALAADRCDEAPQTVLGASRGEIYLVRMRAFLEEFAGRAAEETPDSAARLPDAVQIMTVHQAKGLEFPVVFVPSLVEDRFPSAMMGCHQCWYVPEHLFDVARYEGREDDEARLLYVALTRAEELLVVSLFSRHARKAAKPSRFIRPLLRVGDEVACEFGSCHPPARPGSDVDGVFDTTFSSLIAYQECGFGYWLREECGFRPPLAPELGFGRLLHHLVAELARRAAEGRTPRESDVDDLLATSFYLPFAGPIPRERLRKALRRRVQRYVRDFGDELLRSRQPEARFEVRLGEARLRGRIDLLLSAPEGGAAVELVDFKTSVNRPPSSIHGNQLRLYAAAVEKLGLQPVRLLIHDLDGENGERYEVAFDTAERIAFERDLEGWVDGVKRREFGPPTVVERCSSCDYRTFCRMHPGRAAVRR